VSGFLFSLALCESWGILFFSNIRRESSLRKESVSRHWCEKEWADANFGDQRLKQRLIQTAQLLSEQPERSINMACEDWAQTKAAYRFFDNDKVTSEEILRPHRQCTIQRLQQVSVALILSDTCFLNFHGHPKTKGLGGIGQRSTPPIAGTKPRSHHAYGFCIGPKFRGGRPPGYSPSKNSHPRS